MRPRTHHAEDPEATLRRPRGHSRSWPHSPRQGRMPSPAELTSSLTSSTENPAYVPERGQVPQPWFGPSKDTRSEVSETRDSPYRGPEPLWLPTCQHVMSSCSQPHNQLQKVSGQCKERPRSARVAEGQCQGPGKCLPSPEPQSIYSQLSPSWHSAPPALLPAGAEGKNIPPTADTQPPPEGEEHPLSS